MPEHKGQGDAIELKNELFKISNQQKLPIYLETSVEKNKRVYQRYGFEAYHTWENDSNTLYFMRRMPD